MGKEFSVCEVVVLLLLWEIAKLAGRLFGILVSYLYEVIRG